MNVQAVIRAAMDDRTFPGIVLLVEKEGRVVESVVEGCRQLDPSREEMTADTLFDLASVTKPLSTALLCLHLAGRGIIDLDRRIGDILTLESPPVREITLRQLLLHTGGLRPEPDIYKRFPDPDTIDREEAEGYLLREVPEAAPDTAVVYSCTGYLLAARVLEKAGGARLGDLYREAVTGPCGLSNLMFIPGIGTKERTAATERCGWRKRWIRGEVHDENSFCFGGDGGNAGLFGTARSVLELLSIFDTEGVLNGVRLLSADACGLMHTCLTSCPGGRRAIGFMMQNEDSPAGPEFSPSSFGHTGFTGASVWIDPEKGLKIVALTNRVHFGRDETAPKIVSFRRKLHSAVLKQWG